MSSPRRQAQVATAEQAQIVDCTFDLDALCHLNVGTVLGFELVQWLPQIVKFYEVKLHTENVRMFMQEIHDAKY